MSRDVCLYWRQINPRWFSLQRGLAVGNAEAQYAFSAGSTRNISKNLTAGKLLAAECLQVPQALFGSRGSLACRHIQQETRLVAIFGDAIAV